MTTFITSTIPDVKAALLELWGGGDLGDVQLTYGHPGSKMERELTYLGGTAEWDQEWAELGDGRRNERYTLELFINVQRPGDEQQEATERAFEVLDMLAVGVWQAQASDIDERFRMPPEIVFRALREFIGNEGREAQIEAGVRCDLSLRKPR